MTEIASPPGPRVTLVTGASRGIGRAASLHLAAAGHHVIAVARSKLALEKLGEEIAALGAQATLVPLDLKDGDSIKRLGAALDTKFGRLDGLLANAGILGTLGPLETVGPRSFAETIEINLNANWRLIAELGPLLKKSPAPRAVFITSSVASKPRAFWGPYQASKAGLEALVRGWADETEALGLKANLFDPGGTRTGMRAEAMPGEDPETLPTPEQVAAKLIPLLLPEETRTGALIRARDLA
ncbi:MAG: SDR family NAD(P)-dependent oxidoreductase [Pseudomonadota bacterium]